MITPARFLWALDARTGAPLQNWGAGVDLPGFTSYGVVDVLHDQARGWDSVGGPEPGVGSLPWASPSRSGTPRLHRRPSS
jgi:hypothetical protein